MDDAAKLREEAERCSRWAQSINDPQMLAMLETLRLEFEARASQIERESARRLTSSH
jgi:hypothetical protein